jgi:hypothetical protein
MGAAPALGYSRVAAARVSRAASRLNLRMLNAPGGVIVPGYNDEAGHIREY